MKIVMHSQTLLPRLLIVFFLLFTGESAWAKFMVHSQTVVEMELIGYDGLAEQSLSKKNIPAGGKLEIDTPYSGLALLSFAGGQQYPVLIGTAPFELTIKTPAEPPSFTKGSENDIFYQLLADKEGQESDFEKDSFGLVMIQAKLLLDSTSSVRTPEELADKKEEFHAFVAEHYERLSHSDMVRRLMAQYFMMHEYVSYHSKGAPAGDIRKNYRQAVLDGVGSWLQLLKPYIPEPEILNFCVSLYYNRSMVTLAAVIADNFKDFAFCPGVDKSQKGQEINFPGTLVIAKSDGSRLGELGAFPGEKVLFLVSDVCPVSQVAAVIKARQLADQRKDIPVIIVPLQKLSQKHLSMAQMVSSANMFFVDDEKWRQKNLAEKIKLPFSVLHKGDGK